LLWKFNKKKQHQFTLWFETKINKDFVMCELTWFNKNSFGEIQKSFNFHQNWVSPWFNVWAWNFGVFVQVWSKNAKFKHDKRTCMHYGN